MSNVYPSSKLTWAGLIFMALTGLIHLVEAPEYLEEQRYIGVLFIVAAVGAVVSMFGIWTNRAWGWLIGLAVAGGSVIAYLASRTIGLPGFRERSWAEFLEPSGSFSLVVELLFCYVAIRALAAPSEEPSRQRVRSR